MRSGVEKGAGKIPSNRVTLHRGWNSILPSPGQRCRGKRSRMATFTSKLKKRETLAEGTMGFYFAKPEGFQFKAGQYLDITLVNPPETDAEGNIRSLSIASAPE